MNTVVNKKWNKREQAKAFLHFIVSALQCIVLKSMRIFPLRKNRIFTILENINLFFIAISFLKKNEIHQRLSQAVHCMNQRDANNLLNKLIPTKNSPTVNHKIHLQKN